MEIQEGEVCRWFPLTEELPHTEWLAGTIELKRDSNGLLHAYYNNVIIE